MIVGGPQRFIDTNTDETGAFSSHETTQEAQTQQNMVPVKRTAADSNTGRGGVGQSRAGTEVCR